MPALNGNDRLDRIEANLEITGEQFRKLTGRMNRLHRQFREMVDQHNEEFKKLMA